MNGKIINHASLERDAGISKKQSERHFEILADTLIGQFLYPFHQSVRKRQTQKAKFFFFDTGVTRAIQSLADSGIEESTYEYGDLFESMVINEFFKIESAQLRRWNFSYLQTTDMNHEIDLIIEKPRGKIVLVEIKSFRKIREEKLEYFIRLKESIEHETAYLLSNDPDEQEIRGVRCLHWKKGIEEIFSMSL